MRLEDASWILMLAGVGLAILLLVRGVRARTALRREGTSEDQKPVRFQDRKNQTAEPPMEVLRWQVEMHETARDLKAELDSKLSALQALVLMARQEAQRLETAIRQSEKIATETPRDRLAAIESLADSAAMQNRDRLADVAAQMPSLPGGVPADLFAQDHKALAIARLADEGRSAAQIASQLALPIGDVELCLSLRSV